MACFHPFFGYVFTFVQGQAGTFADGAVDQNTIDVLAFQPRRISVDGIVVDGALSLQLKWNSFFLTLIEWRGMAIKLEIDQQSIIFLSYYWKS